MIKLNIYKIFIHFIALSALLISNVYAQNSSNINPYIIDKIFAFAQEETPLESRNETIKSKQNRI